MPSMLDEHAPWSLSKSDLAAKCPYAFKLRYLDKVARKEGTEAKIGVTAHRAQELVLKGSAPLEATATALAESPNLVHSEISSVESLVGAYGSFYERMQRFKEKWNVVQEFYEQQWAVDRDFNAIDYFDEKAFFRGVVDYAMLTADGYLVVVDHKSGKRRPVDYYSRQLEAYCVLALAHMPDLKGVHGALHFIKTQDIDWHIMRKRDEITGVLRSALREMLKRRADDLAGFEPKPQSLCKWCDYRENCDAGTEHLIATGKLKRPKKPKG